MWHFLLAISLFWAAVANADDLFDDGQFEEIATEVDPDFDDDFDAGTVPSSSSNSFNSNAEPGMVISDTYGLFSGRDLARREKSISIFGGNDTIASQYHVLLFPQARFEVMKFYGHLGVPLRFPVYDNTSSLSRGIRTRGFVSGETFITPRRGDFRSFWDVQRAIRHMELNEETENYFFRLSRINAITMGQGELMRGMALDGLYDQDFMYLSGHVGFENGRVQGFLGPLFKAEMFGIAARLTPLYSLDAPAIVRDLNFEIAYMNDFMAPNQAERLDDAYLLTDDQRHVERNTGSAQAITFGVATEYFATPWLSLKPYTSMGNLWLTGLKRGDDDLVTRYGAGWHLGHDTTFYFSPGTKKSILVLKTEGRIFSRRYWPGYFGSTYMIDRDVINEPGNQAISNVPTTKSQYLGEHRSDHARWGYLFEVGYLYDKVISATLGYENARSFLRNEQVTPMRKLHAVVGFVGLEMLRFHLGYQASSLAQMDELFDFEKSRALLSLRGQLKLASFLYLDTWAKHSFGINDMFTNAESSDDNATWLSHNAETRSINFGLGLEFAMTF